MNVYEIYWKELLHEVIMYGKNAQKDDSEIKEIIGNHIFIEFDSFTKQYLTSRNFLELVKKGSFDIEKYPLKSNELYVYINSIDDESKIYLDEDNSFIYTYPERLKNYNGFNQLSNVILERLKYNEGSNRAISTTLIPQIDSEREDIPCLQSLQALIRENELILSVFFRSNDLYGAWVSNMMFLTNIGLKLVDELKKTYPNLLFKGIDYHSSSLHIYKTDLENARRIIE